jgi:hypothetical protein
MISVQQSLRLLNKGEEKYTEEEAQAILGLLRKLAHIDYEDYRSNQSQDSNSVPTDRDKSDKRGEQ